MRDEMLDALRGISILLVICHHVGLRAPDSIHDPLAKILVGIGWGGVDIFFAISGFLITRILLRPGTSRALPSFFARRLFRIVPVYLLALVTFAIASMLSGVDRSLLSSLWINVLFLTAWFVPFLGQTNIPFLITWSVSVEEFAYILFGGLSLCRSINIKTALIGIMIASLLVRYVMVYVYDYPPESMYYFAPGRIDTVAAGGLLATLVSFPGFLRKTRPIFPLLLTLSLLGIINYYSRNSAPVAVIAYSLTALSSALLVGTIVARESKSHGFVVAVAAQLGLVSYFVYLFHMFTIYGLVLVSPDWPSVLGDFWVLVAVTAGLTYGAARMSWVHFELPLIQYGRSLYLTK